MSVMCIDSKITVVILAGGSGSRLWPVSRQDHPKPFIKLADGETLIQKAYIRAKALSSKILTVTNRDYYFMCRDAQQSVGTTGDFLLEPFGRNTAPAIAMAADLIATAQGPDTVMLVLTADHLISEHREFYSAVADAARLADLGHLVTFGIVPTAPETGFGYIEKGEFMHIGHKVARFVEKPDFALAQDYVNSGNFLWNSGMFCFKAGVLLEELSKTAPEVAQSIDDCSRAMRSENSSIAEIPAEIFKNTPDVSFDYAVMEKSQKVAVIPCDFGWNDIGSWSAIRDLATPDQNQNRVLGEAIFVDTKNTYIQSEDRLVAAVGISDLIIIDTPDSLLVAHPDRVQDVKEVVSQLKAKNHSAFRLHRTVVRPWGTYTVLEEAPGFKIKRIEVRPGASLSLQMHHFRSEHWVVVDGEARITNGEKETMIQANESTYIPAGQKHRLENPGTIPCVMIEVQCGSYLGEDDIVRFEDTYGRK